MEIDLNESRLKRGDSYRFAVTISDGTFASTDTLLWVARRKITDVDAVISKSSTAGGITRLSDTTAEITIVPADTNALTKNTSLVWEFQRTTITGDVDTLILGDGETVGRLTIEVDLIR